MVYSISFQDIDFSTKTQKAKCLKEYAGIQALTMLYLKQGDTLCMD